MEWSKTYNNLTNSLAGENGNTDDVDALIPDIVRLIEDPEIKKEIAFDEISLNLSTEQTGDPTIQSRKSDIGGISYPVIRINDYVFSPKSVRYMNLSCTSFLPTITVKIETIESNVLNKNMPKDGDMLSLFMRTTTSALEFVRCDFIITSVSTNNIASTIDVVNSSLVVNGTMFIPRFNATVPNTLAYIGTTREVLRHIAEEFRIGFAYNDEDNTEDLQNWINCNRSIPDFINELTWHSWKDNLSFYKSWIDIYYNLVYVNVNKYFNSDKNNSEIDVTFMTNVISAMDTAKNDTNPDKTHGLPKILTTLPMFRGTPFYIKKWNPSNNSTNVSFNIGYSVNVCSFMHNQGLMNENIIDSFSTLECVPSYNKEKTKSEMILRGRSKYDAEQNPDMDLETINYDFVNTYVKKEWYGILYPKSDDENDINSNDNWSGNVHKNYALAVYHNKINRAELEKLYITVECEGLNLQVQKGEYVPVLIGFRNEADNLMNNSINDFIQGANLSGNRMYSGYYFVDGVQYVYKYSDNESFSDFSTIFTLKRREWPTPEKIEVENNEEKLPNEEVENGIN